MSPSQTLFFIARPSNISRRPKQKIPSCTNIVSSTQNAIFIRVKIKRRYVMHAVQFREDLYCESGEVRNSPNVKK